MRYERAFAKALAAWALNSGKFHCYAGQWLRFTDEHGTAYCQPDIYLDVPNRIYVFECKLTDTTQAEDQLLRLYIPVLRFIYKKPVCGITVTRHLRPDSKIDAVVDNVLSAMQIAQTGIEVPVYHWREHNPL